MHMKARTHNLPLLGIYVGALVMRGVIVGPFRSNSGSASAQFCSIQGEFTKTISALCNRFVPKECKCHSSIVH